MRKRKMDARLLVLERDVESEDERVLNPLRHVRVPTTMVHNESADKLSLRGRPVLHFHDLDHMEVNRAPPLILCVCTTF
jgi:hypothetical protein